MIEISIALVNQFRNYLSTIEYARKVSCDGCVCYDTLYLTLIPN